MDLARVRKLRMLRANGCIGTVDVLCLVIRRNALLEKLYPCKNRCIAADLPPSSVRSSALISSATSLPTRRAMKMSARLPTFVLDGRRRSCLVPLET